ncbi:hypothetical protein [Leptospira interrogans]|uniref:hypothetical protein n=1 Tax=Leptospira interrogans TaxID=173 RepID=UPI000774E43D|nr:hypothetical protein [Leptospira interrogans]
MKNAKPICFIALTQIIIGLSFLKCEDRTNKVELNGFGKRSSNCNILRNVARIYEGKDIKIILCLPNEPSDLEIKLNSKDSDFFDIIKAECNGLNCLLEAEYKTSASDTLKMKIFGETLENGYVQIEINGKKAKFEYVD